MPAGMCIGRESDMWYPIVVIITMMNREATTDTAAQIIATVYCCGDSVAESSGKL